MAASQHCSADKRGGQPGRNKENKITTDALLETLLELIETVAVDQHAGHIIAPMQEQQVGFRVRDGAVAMISAVRKFLRNDTNKVLKAYGSSNAPLCASQFVRDATVAVVQEQEGNGKKSELHNRLAKGVWQGSTLSRATFCLTFWSKMQELLERPNLVRLVMSFISYADDFAVSSDDDDDEADRLWDDTGGALKEIDLEMDQSKPCFTKQERTECGTTEHSLSRRRL